MMRNHFRPTTLALFWLALVSLPALGGELLDRIAATVNGHVILHSDWDQLVRYEAFLNGVSVGQVSMNDRKTALDRLIDQELIRQQMRADFLHASPADVDKHVAEIRQQRPEWANDANWKAALAAHGLTEDEIRKNAALELDELRVVDAHFRPDLQVDSRSIESYYRERLLPELRQAGGREVPLEDVAPKIKELLAQQKMNDLLASWLRSLRAESIIHTPADSAAAGGGGS